MPKFTVTYDRWTQDDLEVGESSDSGFLYDEAVEISAEELELICWGAEPSVFPYDKPASYVFLNVNNANQGTREYFESGIVENHTYHPADGAAIEALFKAWTTANSQVKRAA